MSVIVSNLNFGSLLIFIIILILLCISALISGSENAFFSLNSKQISRYKDSSQKTHKEIILLIENPKTLIATILITNNFVNTTLVIVSTFLLNNIIDFGQHKILGFIVQVVIITIIILFFGEILPKVYATQKSEKIILLMTKPLILLKKIFSPLIFLLVSSTSLIDKRISKKSYNITISELSNAIDITTNESYQNDETKILKSIVNFGDIIAKEIMKSRIDIASIEKNTTFNKLLLFIKEVGYSRIPVYNENIDNIEGILYIKDILPYLNYDNNFVWNKLIRPAFFIPENKKINDLLKEFQYKKIHLAIVVDEYGGTSGIITLEDILEEIVGEINDEFDIITDDINYSKINDNKYIFEGKTKLNDFYKILNTEKIFENIKGESDTLAGLILEIQGKIPEKNAIVKIKNFTFQIESVDNRRIKKITVTIDKYENPIN